MAWKAWMAVRGAAADPALMQRAAHAASTPRGIVDQLAELGGAGAARDRGSDRHQILALALSGATLPDLPPEARAELDAVLRLVEELGTVEALDLPTVCDRWQVCGSVDLVLRARDGATVVCDFKTGSRVDRLGHSIQLVAYAASHVWDFTSESRGPLLAPDRPRLVVLHAPQDGSAPAVVELDLQDAKRWADLAAAVRDARRQAAGKAAA